MDGEAEVTLAEAMQALGASRFVVMGLIARGELVARKNPSDKWCVDRLSLARLAGNWRVRLPLVAKEA